MTQSVGVLLLLDFFLAWNFLWSHFSHRPSHYDRGALMSMPKCQETPKRLSTLQPQFWVNSDGFCLGDQFYLGDVPLWTSYCFRGGASAQPWMHPSNPTVVFCVHTGDACSSSVCPQVRMVMCVARKRVVVRTLTSPSWGPCRGRMEVNHPSAGEKSIAACIEVIY